MKRLRIDNTEEVDEFVDKIIEQRQKIVAKQANYQMTDHSLIIYGVCNKCSKKTKA